MRYGVWRQWNTYTAAIRVLLYLFVVYFTRGERIKAIHRHWRAQRQQQCRWRRRQRQPLKEFIWISRAHESLSLSLCINECVIEFRYFKLCIMDFICTICTATTWRIVRNSRSSWGSPRAGKTDSGNCWAWACICIWSFDFSRRRCLYLCCADT